MPITAVALPGKLTVPWTRHGVAAGNGTVSESASTSASSACSGWGVLSFMTPYFLLCKERKSRFFLLTERRKSNIDAIRDNEGIDLTVDSPPDLVIEIDITSPSLDKFPLYAAVGVPEVWRYDGTHVTMYCLAGEHYVEVTHSTVLPPLTNERATRFLEERKQAP